MDRSEFKQNQWDSREWLASSTINTPSGALEIAFEARELGERVAIISNIRYLKAGKYSKWDLAISAINDLLAEIEMFSNDWHAQGNRGTGNLMRDLALAANSKRLAWS